MSRQLLGVDPTQVRSTANDESAEFELGSVAYGDDGKRYMYVEAAGAIAPNVGVKVAIGFQATASGNAGLIEGANVTGETLADGDFFWMQTQGVVPNFNVADAATAGQLMSILADANGDGVVISAFAATGTHHVRGKILENAATGLADVILY